MKAGNAIDLVEALNNTINDTVPIERSVSQLLYFAKIGGDFELEKWAKNELTGYKKDDSLPSYRCFVINNLVYSGINGSFQVKNQPLPLELIDNETLKIISDVEIRNDIGSIRKMAEENSSGMIDYTNLAGVISDATDGEVMCSSIRQILQPSVFQGICAHVKERIITELAQIISLNEDATAVKKEELEMLTGFPTERIKVIKDKENEFETKALVQPDCFFIPDCSVMIDEGCFFERMLPNGGKEYYKVIDRGYMKGRESKADHYQTKVKKISRQEMDGELHIRSREKDNKREHKLFISHSSKDKAIIIALVELLEDIGMPEYSVVCTSVPGYGIPGGENIFDWLRRQFLDYELRIVFALSENYYSSAASLNEMGAAWVTRATETILLLPGFDASKVEGCIDSRKMAINCNSDESELKHRLDEFKDVLVSEYNIPNLSLAKWERIRNSFIEKVRIIKNEVTVPR